jgi:hypothetical protein
MCGEPGECVIDFTNDPVKWRYMNPRKKLRIKIIEREKYYAEKEKEKSKNMPANPA